eukprot:jgi/Bigna1/130011/aug1.10_g4719
MSLKPKLPQEQLSSRSSGSDDDEDEDDDDDVVRQMLERRKADAEKLRQAHERTRSLHALSPVSSAMSTSSVSSRYPSKQVSKQYFEYPYPSRDPEDEKEGFCFVSPSNLLELNHFVFGGRLPLRKYVSEEKEDEDGSPHMSNNRFAQGEKEGHNRVFRVLVAGCGTGDAVILLCKQLTMVKNIRFQVTGLDPSPTSLKIAKARCKMHKFRYDPQFYQGTIDKVEDLFGEKPDNSRISFSYIDVSGVLHHLEDPSSALCKLRSVLHQEGGMGVMLYGKYGRTGVYEVQRMLRRIGTPTGTGGREGGTSALGEKIRIAKKLLKALPKCNWFARNKTLRECKDLDSDNGVVDLLLHAHDVPFSVEEVFRLAERSNMVVTGFPRSQSYSPDRISDPEIKEMVKKLPWPDQFQFVEEYVGDIHKHIFYLVRNDSKMGKRCQESIRSPKKPGASIASDSMILPAFPRQDLQRSLKCYTLNTYSKLALDKTDLFAGVQTVGNAFLALKSSANLSLSWPDFCRDIEATFDVIEAKGLGVHSTQQSINLLNTADLSNIPCRS